MDALRSFLSMLGSFLLQLLTLVIGFFIAALTIILQFIEHVAASFH